MIIHINGMPGVGKLTVAKLLAEKIDARLIDNHLIIDLAMTVCEDRGAEYSSVIKKLMNIILEQINKSGSQPFIFTNALASESGGDRERFDQIKSFAENRQFPFIQILLKSELEENKRRVVSENRQAKGKLTDATELEKLWKYTIYHPPAVFALEIDSTNLSAKETAAKITDYIHSIKC